jgi:hypothetical protein
MNANHRVRIVHLFIIKGSVCVLSSIIHVTFCTTTLFGITGLGIRAHVPEGDEDEPPRKIGPKDLRNVIPKPVIPKRVVVLKVACMIDESTQTDPFIIKRCTMHSPSCQYLIL